MSLDKNPSLILFLLLKMIPNWNQNGEGIEERGLGDLESNLIQHFGLYEKGLRSK